MYIWSNRWELQSIGRTFDLWFLAIRFINQTTLYNHALCVVVLRRCWCWLDIEASYLVHVHLWCASYVHIKYLVTCSHVGTLICCPALTDNHTSYCTYLGISSLPLYTKGIMPIYALSYGPPRLICVFSAYHWWVCPLPPWDPILSFSRFCLKAPVSDIGVLPQREILDPPLLIMCQNAKWALALMDLHSVPHNSNFQMRNFWFKISKFWPFFDVTDFE